MCNFLEKKLIKIQCKDLAAIATHPKYGTCEPAADTVIRVLSVDSAPQEANP